MTYRDLVEAEGTDGELSGRSRHGSHRLDTETGMHRYVYERPANAPTRSRSRHAAPEAGSEAEQTPRTRRDETPQWDAQTTTGWRSERSSRWDTDTDTYGAPGGYSTSGGYGGSNYGEDAPGGSNYDTGSYGGLNYDGPIDHDTVPSGRRSRWDDGDTDYADFGSYRPRGGEPSAWDERALSAAAGVPYRRPEDFLGDRTEPLASVGGVGDRTEPLSSVGATDDRTAQLASLGTLTAPRPQRGAPPTPPRRATDEAPTEIVEPAEAEVPLTPPTEGGRLRFLGKKHVGLRVAAVSVLVLGSAVGVAVGVLRDSDADKVKVTDDVQANVAASAAPTPDATTGQTPTPSADTALLIKQRQQEALNSAKKLAASRAAAAQSSASARAKEADKARASRSDERSSESGTTGDAVPTAPVDCKTYSGNKATGCALLQEFGFASSQMSCLDNIFTKESQWNETAENSSSGAYGIPQALPGDKMASVASDWKTNPATQIRWGLGYIKDRYGTPCDAWAHWQANNSY
jgi:hypothetical protein